MKSALVVVVGLFACDNSSSVSRPTPPTPWAQKVAASIPHKATAVAIAPDVSRVQLAQLFDMLTPVPWTTANRARVIDSYLEVIARYGFDVKGVEAIGAYYVQDQAFGLTAAPISRSNEGAMPPQCQIQEKVLTCRWKDDDAVVAPAANSTRLGAGKRDWLAATQGASIYFWGRFPESAGTPVIAGLELRLYQDKVRLRVNGSKASMALVSTAISEAFDEMKRKTADADLATVWLQTMVENARDQLKIRLDPAGTEMTLLLPLNDKLPFITPAVLASGALFGLAAKRDESTRETKAIDKPQPTVATPPRAETESTVPSPKSK